MAGVCPGQCTSASGSQASFVHLPQFLTEGMGGPLTPSLARSLSRRGVSAHGRTCAGLSQEGWPQRKRQGGIAPSAGRHSGLDGLARAAGLSHLRLELETRAPGLEHEHARSDGGGVLDPTSSPERSLTSSVSSVEGPDRDSFQRGANGVRVMGRKRQIAAGGER